jgi:hypothetical protein
MGEITTCPTHFNNIRGCYALPRRDHPRNLIRDFALPFNGHGAIEPEVLGLAVSQAVPATPAQDHFARLDVLGRLVPKVAQVALGRQGQAVERTEWPTSRRCDATGTPKGNRRPDLMQALEPAAHAVRDGNNSVIGARVFRPSLTVTVPAFRSTSAQVSPRSIAPRMPVCQRIIQSRRLCSFSTCSISAQRSA